MFNCCLALHFPKIPEETVAFNDYDQDVIGDASAYNHRFNDYNKKKTIDILWCSVYRPYTYEIRELARQGHAMNHFVGIGILSLFYLFNIFGIQNFFPK